MPSVDEFRSAIRSQFREAEARCLPNIEINSGQLHRKLSGYPGPKAQMPSCCQAMYHEKKPGDEIISRPPKGKGATLTILYRLPRLATSIFEAPSGERPGLNILATPISILATSISADLEIVDRGHRRLKVEGYDFELICEIEPRKNADGSVKRFMPQSQYENLRNLSLNKYGEGPF